MEGSADLAHARIVAHYIDSIHHEYILTPQQCLDDIPLVIRAIESFDVTTVRASVGNYNVGKLVSSVNKSEGLNIRVLLNGDGADELLGGYLYMRAAPSDREFERETTRLLEDIHLFDVLRSERCMAAHGLESRSPFLDRQFVSLMRSLPTEVLRGSIMEKEILRKSFETLLPKCIVWRRKEAFSDGMSGSSGKSWYEIARKAAIDSVASSARVSGTVEASNVGLETERHHYREIFCRSFPESLCGIATPYQWMPKFIESSDPSARTLPIY